MERNTRQRQAVLDALDHAGRALTPNEILELHESAAGLQRLRDHGLLVRARQNVDVHSVSLSPARRRCSFISATVSGSV